jgi:hypothetical protein
MLDPGSFYAAISRWDFSKFHMMSGHALPCADKGKQMVRYGGYYGLYHNIMCVLFLDIQTHFRVSSQ